MIGRGAVRTRVGAGQVGAKMIPDGHGTRQHDDDSLAAS
jgi:hypothetical protein